MFRAFLLTEFYQIKIVILGQDPYHGSNQADGLSFSVFNNTPIPPSLKNIFLELKSNIKDFRIPKNGSLEYWSKQGVFLLNTVLTVEKGNPGSHFNRGWEIFTNKVIKLINDFHKGIVFLLWGKYARSKKNIINRNNHFILESVHPSPLSAKKGFFGCQHFSTANKILISQGKDPIIW